MASGRRATSGHGAAVSDRRSNRRFRRRVRIVLAGIAVLLLAASYAFLLENHQPRARARLTSGSRAVDLGGLAAEVQANIAAEHVQSTERSSQVDRHELSDPDDAPPASERPAIRRARALVKRW